MSNFDDLFDAQPRQEQEDHPFDKEARAEKKQTERQEVYELADATTLEVSEDGEKFKAFLDVKSRLIHYSATNALLVLAQKPLATQLRDFESWKAEGVSIKRNESHIKILEAGDNYERPDGSIGTSWNVKRVFDVSQTNSRQRQRPAPQADDRQLLQALIHKPPVPIQGIDELPSNMGAYYDHDQSVIFVRRGMEAHDIFRSLSKEIAHAELAGADPNYTRADAGFAAYSISYVVCKRYGVDVSGYDFSRLPDSFRDADPQSIRATLNEISDVAKDMTGRMNRALEQNKPPRAKGQER